MHITFLGDHFTSLTGAFRIVVGPISADDCRRFLPGTDDFIQLVTLTRFCVKDALEFDVVLRVSAEDLPGVELSAKNTLPLGQLSWLSPSGEAARESLSMEGPQTRKGRACAA